MQFNIHVQELDKEYTVRTSLFTIVAWERKFKVKAHTLANGFGAEDLAYMAYESCKQQSIPVPITFDEYLKRLVNVSVVDVDANPTTGEQSPVS